MFQAFSDHSDLVARRMGFIPLPLGVVMVRVLAQALNLESPASISLLLLGYLCMTSFRVLISLVILGKACDLITQHRLVSILILCVAVNLNSLF